MKNLGGETQNETLDNLHTQCQEWLSEISFWQEEMKFFEELLEKNALKELKFNQKVVFEKLQNQIIYYRGELLDRFEHDVKAHQKALARETKKAASISEANYETHNTLSDQLAQFDKEFKNMKRELFDLIRQLK